MEELVTDPPKVVLAFDAFISYSSSDSAIVERIASNLEDHGGLSIWKDNWELTGGDDWLDALPAAIARSRALVAFVGPRGLGPWHKEEIKIALRRAVERGDMRLVPVALPGAPADLDLPEFLRSRHVVDFRNPDEWAFHLLRSAIVGARPGRRVYVVQETAEAKQDAGRRSSRLQIVEWAIEDTFLQYKIRCRLANVQGSQTVLVQTLLVRTHKIERHPIDYALRMPPLAPIGGFTLPFNLAAPLRRAYTYQRLDTQRFLRPGEVEDIVIHIDIEHGWRAVVSFGFHWLVADEPASRLAETGYAAIGRRGEPPVDHFLEVPTRDGRCNLDKPITQSTPDWPAGWPSEVSTEEFEHYGEEPDPGW